uniref:Uncharacterized protein n=1 Tax=Erwinia amylovora ATCC BAA-2158 TaxID=889211 RepID=E5B611_ERWAM|nr:hypothetical protein predicted by Glimmer/Critica [Erwinia amylovora ATCC BAA-2158]
MVEGVINMPEIACGLTVMRGFTVINLTPVQNVAQINSK